MINVLIIFCILPFLEAGIEESPFVEVRLLRVKSDNFKMGISCLIPS